MALSPIQTVGLFSAGVWLLWRVLLNYIRRSPLHNIPGPSPYSRLFGHFPLLFDRQGWKFHDSLVDKSVVRLNWFFGSDVLYITDPKALQTILKDDVAFEPDSFIVSGFKLIFGHALLGTIGDVHRQQRRMLNPVFSIANMRQLTPVFYAVTYKLKDALTSQLKGKPKEIDMLNWMGRMALELIGQGGLGHSLDSLVEDVPNALGDSVKSMMPTLMACGVWRMLTPLADNYIPLPLRRPLSYLLPDSNVQKLMSISDMMYREARKIFYEKERALQVGDEAVKQQVSEGKDVMSILLKANSLASVQDKIPEDDLIAMMSMLVFAATDTTSNTLSMILDMLAQRQDVQDKLRKEIIEAKDGAELSYDDLEELPYLDAVCRETLRMFPPVVASARGTQRDTVLPLSEPIRGVDGTIIREIPLPKGATVFVGIRASNRSTLLWGQDAGEWKPERWLSKMPDQLIKAKIPGVYSHLLTFLGGGRACIGFRYSQLEMKVVLSVLLESFKFSTARKDIIWNIADVTYPSIGTVSTTPTLPLIVEALPS